MECTLALVNGLVADPVRGTLEGADVAVDNGTIVGISRERGRFVAAQQIDVAGQIVCPALVDSHVHCYEHVSPGSLNPDRIGVRQGVGAVVDAGSFGPRNAAGFWEYVVQPAATRVYGLVNIARYGNSTNPGEGAIAEHLNPTEVVRLVERNRAWVVGVKVRASFTATGALGVMSTRLGKQAASEAGVPLMVHTGNAPPTLDEVCSLLTEGDIITHCFHGKLGGAVTRQGKMLPSVVAAVERGVLLDVGHGSASFAWSTAEQALALGFPPHIISTDLHRGCVDGPVYSQVATMAKLLHLGMNLIDVIRASTLTPARALGIDGLFGRVDVGGPANLSVIEVVERAADLPDSEKQRRTVTKQIVARQTVHAGKVYPADLGGD